MASASAQSSSPSPDSTPVFPLGLCIAAAIGAGLALTAAAIGAQWGAAPPARETLQLSFGYVNISVVGVVFLLWPAVALGASRRRRALDAALTWDLPAIALAVAPALVLSAWLSSAAWPDFARTLALHAAFAIFELGLLSWRGRTAGRRAAIATIGVVLMLALPMLAYLDREFLGRSSSLWELISPPLAVLGSNPSAPWWTAAGFAIIGASLFALSPRPRPESSNA